MHGKWSKDSTKSKPVLKVRKSPVFARKVAKNLGKQRVFRGFCRGQHFYPLNMVEVTGLEPTTSWSLTKRATKLRYTSILQYCFSLRLYRNSLPSLEKQHNLLYMILQKSKTFLRVSAKIFYFIFLSAICPSPSNTPKKRHIPFLSRGKRAQNHACTKDRLYLRGHP